MVMKDSSIQEDMDTRKVEQQCRYFNAKVKEDHQSHGTDETLKDTIANYPTPWHCFVIAVRNEFLEANATTVKIILEIINSMTIDFMEIPIIDGMIANRYELQLEDVQEWHINRMVTK